MRCAFGVMIVAVTLSVAPTRSPDIPFKPMMIDNGASETRPPWPTSTRTAASTSSRARTGIEAPSWTKHRIPRTRTSRTTTRRLQRHADRCRRRRLSGHRPRHLVREEDFLVQESRQGRPAPGSRRRIHAGFNIEFASWPTWTTTARPRSRRAGERHRSVVQSERWARDSGLGIRESGPDDAEPRVRTPTSGSITWSATRATVTASARRRQQATSRNDILTPRGWLEAPADPRATGNWIFLSRGMGAGERSGDAARDTGPPAATSPPAQPKSLELGFMHVLDVNGDGRNDVIAAAGHDFGVFWFEQAPDGSGQARHRRIWSQGHASTSWTSTATAARRRHREAVHGAQRAAIPAKRNRSACTGMSM